MGEGLSDVFYDVAGGADVEEGEGVLGREMLVQKRAEFALGSGPAINEAEVPQIPFEVGIGSRGHLFFTQNTRTQDN